MKAHFFLKLIYGIITSNIFSFIYTLNITTKYRKLRKIVVIFYLRQ